MTARIILEGEVTPAVRGLRAAELRAEGKTWGEIAEQLGYSAPAGAFQAARKHGAHLFAVKEYAARV